MKNNTEHGGYIKGMQERIVYNIIAGIVIAVVICLVQTLTSCEPEPVKTDGKEHNDTTQGGGLIPEQAPWEEGRNDEVTAHPSDEAYNDTTENVKSTEPNEHDNDRAEEPEEEEPGDTGGEVIDPMV